ncbi:MAG: NAD-dependent epimerase [Bauldia sp.]|nr:NAD-dependent epimerase [Bauldia sp.]
MKVLVTGNAGFIGFHVALRLLGRGDDVVGCDVVNDYYDVALKEARLALVAENARKAGRAYDFVRADLADPDAVAALFATHRFDRVIHLAAQAGVRHSLVDPRSYVTSNLVGFANVIEACRRAGTPHLTYASTSSVYGANTVMPLSERQGVDHPLQFYAATKRANELMAHSYSHFAGLPTTGLRFFTVYGPWGRPDMALFKFTRAMLEGKPIPVYNNGNHVRSFTYVDDVVDGLIRASDQIATGNPAWDGNAPDPSTSKAPFRVLNIGNPAGVRLNDYIEALEEALGRKAERELLPLQVGDVPDTVADVGALDRAVGFHPTTPVQEGVARFVAWYRSFYGV